MSAAAPRAKSGQGESVQAASGRRRRENSSAQILAATGRLLADGRSLGTISVDQILAEASLSRATFYACFSDKRAVIAQLAGEALAWREGIHAELLADPSLTHDRLDGLIRIIVNHWQANRSVLAALIELAEQDPETQDAWRHAVNQIAEQAAGHFETRWKGNRNRPQAPGALAAAFTWMFVSCCHHLVTDDATVESTSLAISEILWRTLDYRT